MGFTLISTLRAATFGFRKLGRKESFEEEEEEVNNYRSQDA